MRFADFVEINPTVTLERNCEYPFVGMEAIVPGRRYVHAARMRVANGGGARFQVGDTLPQRRGFPLSRAFPPPPARGEPGRAVIAQGWTLLSAARFCRSWRSCCSPVRVSHVFYGPGNRA